MCKVNLVELVVACYYGAQSWVSPFISGSGGDVVMPNTTHLVGLSDSRVIELPRRSLIPEIETGHLYHLTLTMGSTVAVAGATGRVGRTIVEQIQHENKFSVIGLTRNVSLVKTHILNTKHCLTVR